MSALILIGNTVVKETRSPKEAEKWILRNQSRYESPLWIEPSGHKQVNLRRIKSAEEQLADAAREDDEIMWSEYWMNGPGDSGAAFLSEV